MTLAETLEYEIEQAWLSHCRKKFPTDFGHIDHVKGNAMVRIKQIPTFEDLRKLAWFYYGKHSIYASVYSGTWQDHIFEVDCIDRIFLDFDGNDNLESAWAETQKLVKWFKEQDGKDLTVYFSGKGFHAFIAFPAIPAIQLQNPVKSIRQYVKAIANTLGLHCIDWSVVGDMARISRLPYSPNMKPKLNRKLCVPIENNWNISRILSESKHPTEILQIHFEPVSFVAEELQRLDKQFEPVNYTLNKNINIERLGSEVVQLLEWSKKVVIAIDDNSSIDWDGRHRMIFQLIVPRLVLAGWDDNTILAVCKKFVEDTGKTWRNYERYTTAVIERTRKRIAEGKPLLYNFHSFLKKHPDLEKYFRKDKMPANLKNKLQQIGVL